ncbi:hypothetical protein OAI84_00305, partial [bacterium]|nr:hypothetical protein [bacterium]
MFFVGDVDKDMYVGTINDIVQLAKYNLQGNWSTSGLPDWVGDLDGQEGPATINDIVLLAKYNLSPIDNPLPKRPPEPEPEGGGMTPAPEPEGGWMTPAPEPEPEEG